MPYSSNNDLPKNVKDSLPKHAQEIYRKAYNNALKQYKNPKDRKSDDSLEEVSGKVAWSAVRQSYEKGESGKWHKKD